MVNCYQAPGTQKVLQNLFPPFPLLFLLSSPFPHNKRAAWLLTYRWDRRVKAASWPLGPWEGGGWRVNPEQPRASPGFVFLQP